MTLVDNTYAVFVLVVGNKYWWSINGTLHAVTFPFVEKKLNTVFKAILSRDRPMSDKSFSENWTMIGGSVTEIHYEVRAMVANRSLTLWPTFILFPLPANVPLCLTTCTLLFNVELIRSRGFYIT